MTLGFFNGVERNTNPRFLAYLSATVSNVTGDGTLYKTIFGSEIYDIGSNYNTSTGEFTAPYDGTYILTHQATLNNLTAATYTSSFAEIFTSNRSYRLWQCNPSNVADGQTLRNIATVQVDMDAGDIAYCQVYVNGSATPKSVGVFANTGLMSNHFSGYLFTRS